MKIETNKQTNRKASVAILIPDKIDFKTRDKGPSNPTSGYLSAQM